VSNGSTIATRVVAQASIRRGDGPYVHRGHAFALDIAQAADVLLTAGADAGAVQDALVRVVEATARELADG
jgi:hypothetical protein